MLKLRGFPVLALLLALFTSTASADPFTPQDHPDTPEPVIIVIVQTRSGEKHVVFFKTDLCRNRYYDPQIGRFLSMDPLGMIDGPNMYNFCGGDPVNRIDPMGTDDDEVPIPYKGGSTNPDVPQYPPVGKWRLEYRPAAQGTTGWDRFVFRTFGKLNSAVGSKYGDDLYTLGARGIWVWLPVDNLAYAYNEERKELVESTGKTSYGILLGGVLSMPKSGLGYKSGTTQRETIVERNSQKALDRGPSQTSEQAEVLRLRAQREQQVNEELNRQPLKISEATQFKESVEFTPSTARTYKVFQRNDIDWEQVRTAGPEAFIGKTNAEAARAGYRPQLGDGSFVTLHHSQQNAQGPWFEASTRYHNISTANEAPLHPYKGQQHPDHPLGKGSGSLREDFQKTESPEYWKWREKNRGAKKPGEE
jgi:RHS repeat-associated protein